MKFIHINSNYFSFKHLFAAILCCIGTQLLLAQDTTYINDQRDTVLSIVAATEVRVIMPATTEATQELLVYNNTFQLLKHYHYKLLSPTEKVMHGVQKRFYVDGTLKAQWNIVHGNREGNYTSYWKNGVIKRSETYENDTMRTGTIYNENGEMLPYEPISISATPKEGMPANRQLVLNQIRYPEEARENGIEGMVVVSFVVEKDGLISNVKVTKKVHPLLDKEAKRVISKLPNWNPALYDGEYIRSYFSYPINFVLAQ